MSAARRMLPAGGGHDLFYTPHIPHSGYAEREPPGLPAYKNILLTWQPLSWLCPHAYCLLQTGSVPSAALNPRCLQPRLVYNKFVCLSRYCGMYPFLFLPLQWLHLPALNGIRYLRHCIRLRLFLLWLFERYITAVAFPLFRHRLGQFFSFVPLSLFHSPFDFQRFFFFNEKGCMWKIAILHIQPY